MGRRAGRKLIVERGLRKSEEGIEWGWLDRGAEGSIIRITKPLGPGFLESIYQNAMCVALTNRGIPFETQKAVLVRFEGLEIGIHRLDLIVGQEIIVELKAVKETLDVHHNQVRSYLKASRLKVGLLINFNSSPLFIKRIVN